ncbi:MAG TPA: PorV/PorQ family protein [Candidatus Sulfotelmatobacter sp.]|nr:PorV/PorQ family protein [Candidatus Sulfotelmatobacter sp.]
MRVIIVALLAVLLTGPGANAALDLGEVAVGARPLGLGKAFVGLADDASAIFMNPAGLGGNDNLVMTSMSGSMLNDVNYLMFGASDLSPIGKIGIGYVSASVGSIPLTVLTGSGSTQAITQTGAADYSSSLVVLSYGSRLSRFLRGGAGDNFSLGLNLKFLMQGFSGGDATLQDATGAGMDADLGLLWWCNSWSTLGLTFQNFLPDSLGGRFIWYPDKPNQRVEGIPMVTRLGAHFDLIGVSALYPDPEKALDLLVDYEMSNDQVRQPTWHLGVEYWPLRMFALRAGLDQQAKAQETGNGVDNNFTLGAGLIYNGITFDYAYHQYGELSENAAHYFSIGFRGEDRVKERARRKLEKVKTGVPAPEIVPKPKLMSFSDVPDDYWAKKPIAYLTTLGIMDGYEDGTFRPTQEITRGELAMLLVKAKGFTVDKQLKFTFSDVPPQSETAPYISVAAEREYIQGFKDGTFHPEERVTRAEAAAILAQFAGLYVKKKVNVSPFPDLPKNHWAAPAIAATKEVGLFAYMSGQGFGPNMYLTRAEAAEIIAKTPFAKEQIEQLIKGQKIVTRG